MSLHTEVTDFALRDILEGIADGLNEAQRNLRDVEPYDSFGRANTIYQVPYLEFNLQVTSEFQTVTETGDLGDVSRSFMKFRPAKITSKNEGKTEIYSSISGRFVATVPNEGLPQTVIQIKAEVDPDAVVDGQYILTAQIQNTVGEILQNAKVEFNFDEDTSLALSTAGTLTAPTFEEAEVYTDATGTATTILNILPAESIEDNFFVINVNVGTVNKPISISKF